MENLAERIAELERVRDDIEYRIVTLSFNVMFYNELLEKFASMKNQQLIAVIRQQQGVTQKLAMRFNSEYEVICKKIELLKSSN